MTTVWSRSDIHKKLMFAIQKKNFSKNSPSLEVRELKCRYVEGWASASGLDTLRSSTYFTFSKFLFEWNGPEWHFTAISSKSIQQIHFCTMWTAGFMNVAAEWSKHCRTCNAALHILLLAFLSGMYSLEFHTLCCSDVFWSPFCCFLLEVLCT